MGHVQIGKVPYHRIWISPQACKTATIQSQFKIMPSFWQLIQLITENYSQSQIAEGGVRYAIQGGEKPRITNTKLHNKSLASLTIWIIIFLKFNWHARHVILKSKHRSTKKIQCWEANEGGRRLLYIYLPYCSLTCFRSMITYNFRPPQFFPHPTKISIHFKKKKVVYNRKIK